MAGKYTRSNLEIVSQLPDFEVKESTDFPGYFVVRCTREECSSHQGGVVRPFVVQISAWLEERLTIDGKKVVEGRACPYCFAASRIPAQLRR